MNSSDLLKLRRGANTISANQVIDNVQNIGYNTSDIGCSSSSSAPCNPNPSCLVKGPPGPTGVTGDRKSVV